MQKELWSNSGTGRSHAARKDALYDWERTVQHREWEMACRDGATAEFGEHAEGERRVLVLLERDGATEDRRHELRRIQAFHASGNVEVGKNAAPQSHKGRKGEVARPREAGGRAVCGRGTRPGGAERTTPRHRARCRAFEDRKRAGLGKR